MIYRCGWLEDVRHYIIRWVGHLPITIRTDPNSRRIFLATPWTVYIKVSACATLLVLLSRIRDISFNRSKTFNRKYISKSPDCSTSGTRNWPSRGNCRLLLVARALRRVRKRDCFYAQGVSVVSSISLMLQCVHIVSLYTCYLYIL